MLVTSYDSSKLETVQKFFTPQQQPKAYLKIRLDETPSSSSYREASRTRGRGAKLYNVETLAQIKKCIDTVQSEVLTDLPVGCIDLATIAHLHSMEPYTISAVFKVIGLFPTTTYRRNGARRPVNAYNAEVVARVMYDISKIRESL